VFSFTKGSLYRQASRYIRFGFEAWSKKVDVFLIEGKRVTT